MLRPETKVLPTGGQPPGPPAGFGRPDDSRLGAAHTRAASPATVYVWVLPHAGHIQGLAMAPRAWATHVISFLNSALRPITTTAAAAISS
jgi:hypothetical protein